MGDLVKAQPPSGRPGPRRPGGLRKLDDLGPGWWLVSTIALRAAGAASSFRRPISYACQYVNVARFDAVDLHVESLRAGKRSGGAAHQHDAGRSTSCSLHLVWAMNENEGMVHDFVPTPDLPDPNTLKKIGGTSAERPASLLPGTLSNVPLAGGPKRISRLASPSLGFPFSATCGRGRSVRRCRARTHPDRCVHLAGYLSRAPVEGAVGLDRSEPRSLRAFPPRDGRARMAVQPGARGSSGGGSHCGSRRHMECRIASSGFRLHPALLQPPPRSVQVSPQPAPSPGCHTLRLRFSAEPVPRRRALSNKLSPDGRGLQLIVRSRPARGMVASRAAAGERPSVVRNQHRENASSSDAVAERLRRELLETSFPAVADASSCLPRWARRVPSLRRPVARRAREHGCSLLLRGRHRVPVLPRTGAFLACLPARQWSPDGDVPVEPGNGGGSVESEFSGEGGAFGGGGASRSCSTGCLSNSTPRLLSRRIRRPVFSTRFRTLMTRGPLSWLSLHWWLVPLRSASSCTHRHSCSQRSFLMPPYQRCLPSSTA